MSLFQNQCNTNYLFWSCPWFLWYNLHMAQTEFIQHLHHIKDTYTCNAAMQPQKVPHFSTIWGKTCVAKDKLATLLTNLISSCLYIGLP